MFTYFLLEETLTLVLFSRVSEARKPGYYLLKVCVLLVLYSVQTAVTFINSSSLPRFGLQIFQWTFSLSSQITNPSMLSHIWLGKLSNGFILSNRSPLEDQLIQWPISES